MTNRFKTFNLWQWIKAHEANLKPPVNNQVVWRDREFIIMVVGGPNKRLDYHVNQGEEFFYQLKGDMVLKLYDEGEFIELPIREGEIFLLEGGVPHSPQRSDGSIGLVVEHERPAGVDDGFQWYCEPCGIKLYEHFTPLSDIVSQLPVIFEQFYNEPAHCTCPQCGTHYQKES